MYIRARKHINMHAHTHINTQTHNTLFNLEGTKRHIITGCPVFDNSSLLNIDAALVVVRHLNVAV